MVQFLPRSPIFQNRPDIVPSLIRRPPNATPQAPPTPRGPVNRIFPQPNLVLPPRFTCRTPRPPSNVPLRPSGPQPPPPRLPRNSQYMIPPPPTGAQMTHAQSPTQGSVGYPNSGSVHNSAKSTQSQLTSKSAPSTPEPLTPVENVQSTKYKDLKANIKNLEKTAVVQKQKNIGRYKRFKNQVKRQIKKHPYISGVLLACFSLFMFFNQNNLVRSGINNITVLNRHGFFTKYGLFTEFVWANPPIWARICLFFFQIKNGEEFLNGAKPHLEEVGPFCLQVTRRRRILKWKKKTVKFDESFLLEVDEESSIPLNTSFRTINLPIFAGVYAVKNFMETFYLRFIGPLVYNGIVKALTMTGEELVYSITGYQLLVQYDLKLLKFLDTWVLTPLRSIGIDIPKDQLMGIKMPNMTIPTLGTASGAWVGPIEMYHTTEDGHLVGDIYSALGFKKFPLKAPPCNVMKGGEGYFWRRPIVDDKITLILFYLCRILVFKKEYTHYFYGSFVTRYKFDEDMFRYSDNPENACHCIKDNLRDCDGYHSMAPCIFMAPIGITMAHFYKSPKQLASVVGLTPNADEHDIYMEVETQLGFPVYVHLSLQIVLDIEPISYVSELAHVPKMQFPLLWVKVKIGAIGIMGGLLFVVTTLIHYGNILWLSIGLGGTGYLFYKAKEWRNTP